MSTPVSEVRTRLMAEHAAARHRRELAPLDSEEYRVASEDVARIEVAIAAAEEPGQAGSVPADGGAPTASSATPTAAPAAWETRTA